ncbi:SLBB domain-containing protein [Oscillatoria sp. CS-180]|uniref:SLBB domain-containing protein n=1 Tax=Oscillatoria sp. CS-180 TaxID=3021720 RepID=UPI00232D3BBA|nr:SLBB domain-containing protein [Oscillatoria sp. CS-180]
MALALCLPGLSQSAPLPDLAPIDERSFPSIDNEPVVDSEPVVTESVTDGYVLGAGDRLSVEVFRIPEYSGEYEVLVSGRLSLPMVGQVPVAGLTLQQAQAKISEAYAARLRRPIINLSLVEPRPLRIGIAGEVTHPGSYVLEREGTQFPSLISALEMAGGVTQSADLRQIVVTRTGGSVTEEVLVTDLWEFLQTGDLRYNLDLRDGDTVFIPTRETFDPNESLQLAAASFAADESRPLNIVIIGEVFRPGPYTVTGTARTGEAGVPGGTGGASIPPTVTRAIQVAGGIKPDADIRGVEIYRRTRNGEEQRIGVNLWELLAEGQITQDIVLQEGDTVFIPEAENIPPEELAEIAAASFSPDTIRINVVGEVESPGVVEVPPNTPLSQGILAAGGFDSRRARTTDVDLIRLNPNGTVTRSSVPVDFAAGINDETNPTLRNNDVIVVNRSTSASIADTLDTVVVPLGRVFSLFTIPTSFIRLFD